jgi:CheY-like chemotaxis protein
VKRSAQHLSGKIDGLLDISRIEAGRMQLSREQIRLGEFLDQLAGMFRMQAEGRGLEFRYTASPALPAIVNTDEKRLRQVLINLLSNAVKFTERGFVSFDIAYRNEVAIFTITDSGIGIPPKDIERIFEPFARGGQPKSVKIAGIGLGLTITRLLTEIMGGEVKLRSVPGRGTTATVKVLLARVEEANVSLTTERFVTGYAGPRRTVLIVDDDPDHRDLMQDILAPLGFILFTAPDGGTCLSLAGECEPDLILLDILMPGLNGWEVAERLRENGNPAAILMLSANVGDFGSKYAASEHHNGILAKPIDIQQLLDQIQALLKLEWDFGDGRVVPPEAAGAEIARHTAFSDQGHLDELIYLGRIGHIRAIEAKLDEIAGSVPDAEPFAMHLRSLVKQFDLSGYLTALQETPRHDS